MASALKNLRKPLSVALIIDPHGMASFDRKMGQTAQIAVEPNMSLMAILRGPDTDSTPGELMVSYARTTDRNTSRNGSPAFICWF